MKEFESPRPCGYESSFAVHAVARAARTICSENYMGPFLFFVTPHCEDRCMILCIGRKETKMGKIMAVTMLGAGLIGLAATVIFIHIVGEYLVFSDDGLWSCEGSGYRMYTQVL